jgi:lipoate---protein ligase
LQLTTDTGQPAPPIGQRLALGFDLTLPSVDQDLAFDEALLIEADAGRGRPLVRFWNPNSYAVVLGASCRIAADVFVENCAADRVPIFRRSSGGGTVVVGPGVLCVTVILPEGAAAGLSRVDLAHDYVLTGIAAAIQAAGVSATVRGRGDLVWDDRKFGGSAQRRLKSWFMVHCSILYDLAIERITRYLKTPSRQPEYRAGRSHEDFLVNLSLNQRELADTIRTTFCMATINTLDVIDEVPPQLVHSLLDEKFRNREWIERF